jgi:hypothetical protein
MPDNTFNFPASSLLFLTARDITQQRIQLVNRVQVKTSRAVLFVTRDG